MLGSFTSQNLPLYKFGCSRRLQKACMQLLLYLTSDLPHIFLSPAEKWEKRAETMNSGFSCSSISLVLLQSFLILLLLLLFFSSSALNEEYHSTHFYYSFTPFNLRKTKNTTPMRVSQDGFLSNYSMYKSSTHRAGSTKVSNYSSLNEVIFVPLFVI